MPKTFYNFLIGVIIVDLILNFLRRSDVELFHDPNARGLLLLIQLFMFVSALVKLILMLIHFYKLKQWLIFSTLILSASMPFLLRFAYNAALEDWHNPDYSTYYFLEKLGFWITIVLAAALILADKGCYTWLAIYGALLALFTCFTRIYMYTDGTRFQWLIFGVSFLPELALLAYFFSVRKKSQ